jgi:WD40 repeat protein
LDAIAEPLVLRGHTATVLGIAFGPDGRRIVSVSGDQTVRVWNADGSGTPLVLRGHTDGVNGVAFSPDGSRLATGSDDQTVRIWNVDGTGESVVLSGHAGAVYGVAFSPDGRHVASGSSDNTIRIWRDLERLAPSDPALWSSTNHCLSVARRQQLLSVSGPVARMLHERCLDRVSFARHMESSSP